MKPIVDALTVADSLDAATDDIGRCYTAAKPLEKLDRKSTRLNSSHAT